MYTDDKIKAAASIRTLSLALKISNDRGLKERPGDLNAFEGAQIAVQSITAKDYGRKGGLIGWMRCKFRDSCGEKLLVEEDPRIKSFSKL